MKDFFDKKTILVALISALVGIVVFTIIVWVRGSALQESTQVLLNTTTESADGETVVQEYVSPLLHNYITDLQKELQQESTEVANLRNLAGRQATRIEEMQDWQPLPSYRTSLRNPELLADTSNIRIGTTFSCENSNESIGGELQHPILGQIDFDLEGEQETSVQLAKKCQLGTGVHLGVAAFRASASDLESRTHQMRTHFVLFLYNSNEAVFAVSDPLVIEIPYDYNFSFTRNDSTSVLVEGKYGDAGHLFEQSAVFDLKSFTFTKNELGVHSPDIEFQE